jgi:hypothetical protein
MTAARCGISSSTQQAPHKQGGRRVASHGGGDVGRCSAAAEMELAIWSSGRGRPWLPGELGMEKLLAAVGRTEGRTAGEMVVRGARSHGRRRGAGDELGVGVLPRSFCSCAHQAGKEENGAPAALLQGASAREEGAMASRCVAEQGGSPRPTGGDVTREAAMGERAAAICCCGEACQAPWRGGGSELHGRRRLPACFVGKKKKWLAAVGSVGVGMQNDQVQGRSTPIYRGGTRVRVSIGPNGPGRAWPKTRKRAALNIFRNKNAPAEFVCT